MQLHKRTCSDTAKGEGGSMKKRKNTFKKDFPLYLMALPGVAVLIAFSYVPMAGLILVFKDYNFKGGIFKSPWADPLFKNFEFFFNNMDNAIRATRNTIGLNILFFIFGTIFAVAIAIMLSEVKNKHFIKVSQSVMFFPYFISWMVMGAILNALLSSDVGIISDALQKIGIHFDFYSSPGAWVVILVLAVIWQSTGYNSVIYYGVLSGFDTSIYEAAEVDGATKWQQITKITLPLLRPTITIMFLLSVGNMLKGNLNMMIGLTNLNPMLLEVTDVIDVFVYRSGVQNGDMAFASAVSLYQSIFGFVLVLVSNKLAKMYDSDTSLF